MGSRIQAAAREIVSQGAQFDRWGTLALMDVSLRYRRTVIGPLWITLTLAATIASVGTVYATLFKQDIAVFLPSFAVGLIVWTLIAGTLQEGSNVFVASSHLIKAVPAPMIVHVLQMTARNVVIFLHHLLLVGLLYLVMPWPLHWTLVLAVPAGDRGTARRDRGAAGGDCRVHRARRSARFAAAHLFQRHDASPDLRGRDGD
jgi:ABC-type polysaccharide/polyol phosphate export permease